MELQQRNMVRQHRGTFHMLKENQMILLGLKNVSEWEMVKPTMLDVLEIGLEIETMMSEWD